MLTMWGIDLDLTVTGENYHILTWVVTWSIWYLYHNAISLCLYHIHARLYIAHWNLSTNPFIHWHASWYRVPSSSRVLFDSRNWNICSDSNYYSHLQTEVIQLWWCDLSGGNSICAVIDSLKDNINQTHARLSLIRIWIYVVCLRCV
jgi:hypothetical protein